MEKLVINYEEFFAIKFWWTKDYEDVDGYPAAVNFKVVEISSYDEETKEIDYTDYTKDFEEAFKVDPMCNGFIKWDGCMEIHNFTHHFCGYNTMMQELMKTIYLKSKKIMGDRMDNDLANFKNIK